MIYYWAGRLRSPPIHDDGRTLCTEPEHRAGVRNVPLIMGTAGRTIHTADTGPHMSIKSQRSLSD